MYIKQSKLTESYKKIILGFVAVTVILILVVIYFSASKATITVTAQSTKVETDFVADVATDGALTGGVTGLQGVLFEAEVSDEADGASSGTAVLGDNTIGKVTLYNNRDEDQVLVKTTRLLSADNVLLRLSSKVLIPAKGEAQADVYADNASAFTQLEPCKLTIPGLWEGLQTLVYAENKTTLKSSGESVKTVEEVDLTAAQEKLKRQVDDKAKAEFYKQLSGNYEVIVVQKDILEKTANAKVKDQVNDFKVGMKAEVTMIAVSRDEILKLAGERLNSVVPAGKELQNLDLNNFTFSVHSFDSEQKTAKIKVHVEGGAGIKADNPLFDKEKLKDLSKKAVELYLSTLPEVKQVKVDFSPFWVNKVPKFKNNIEIIIEK